MELAQARRRTAAPRKREEQAAAAGAPLQGPDLATALAFDAPIHRCADGCACLPSGMQVSHPDDPEEREADRIADRIMRSAAGPGDAVRDRSGPVQVRPAVNTLQRDGAGSSAPSGSSGGPSTEANDVPKPAVQPSQFPPQELPKTGSDRTSDMTDKLSKGAGKVAGEISKQLWDLFSNSVEGQQILDRNKHDVERITRFFSDLADTWAGRMVLGGVGAAALGGAVAAAWSTREPARALPPRTRSTFSSS